MIGTYSYRHPMFQKNQEAPRRVDGYATDLLKEKSFEFLDEAIESKDPFFLMIATVAPHASSDRGIEDDLVGEEPKLDKNVGNAPIPAPRHQKLFPDITVPNPHKNVNPGVASGGSWVREMPLLSDAVMKSNNDFYRLRLQTLQAVDELVRDTVQRLEKAGILDNTYIIYSTDNGFHIGHHRLLPGKRSAYEEDINIPMIIRGPGVPKGKKTDIITSHTDVVPTILGWANIPLRPELDGKPMPTKADELATETNMELSQVEHWGGGNFAGAFAKGTVLGINPEHLKNTYKAIRVVSKRYSLQYTVWCDGSHELYDMTTDLGQMNNRLVDSKDDSAKAHATNGSDTTKRDLGGTGGSIKIGDQDVTVNKLQERLDLLLLVTKDCQRESCRSPWGAVFKDGTVKTLKDALKTEHDQFFKDQKKKVKFDECTQGYIPEKEGPMWTGRGS